MTRNPPRNRKDSKHAEEQAKNREKYLMVPNFYPCKIEVFGRWGSGLKNYFNTKIKPRLQAKAKYQHNDKIIQQWKMRLTMGMFKSFANNLNGRVQVVMERNRVSDREYAGLKPISDEEQYRIDNFGALTFVSTIKGSLSPFSVD
jgi:hypothetical protein